MTALVPPKGVPHPLSYQGSKRRLAGEILRYVPASTSRLVEPFCGSAAMSLAALAAGKVHEVVLADVWPPLMQLWEQIVGDPEYLAQGYQALWEAQHEDPRAHYLEVRSRFNADSRPELLLYLLVRCVKNAVRLNSRGQFNQSADHRRRGTKPAVMRARLCATQRLLKGRVRLDCGDFRQSLQRALFGNADGILCHRQNRVATTLVYLDPPYQGVGDKNRRYAQQISKDDLEACMEELNRRHVPFLLSYDGRRGAQSYGQALRPSLGLHRVELQAGPSSQSTLLGQRELTYESLYLSPALRRALGETEKANDTKEFCPAVKEELA